MENQESSAVHVIFEPNSSTAPDLPSSADESSPAYPPQTAHCAASPLPQQPNQQHQQQQVVWTIDNVQEAQPVPVGQA